jgi:hypothetical protein
MASIADMCWSSSENLFREIDIDLLYDIQSRTIAGNKAAHYPFMLLIHTGKITIGLDVEHLFAREPWFVMHDDDPVSENGYALLMDSSEKEV